MSLEAYIWAANLPLSVCNGTSHRVLLKLADRADEYGYGAYPSVANMAASLECSPRTVQRALRDLLEHDLIRVGDQHYVAHLRRDQRPTVYDVVTTAMRFREQARERGDIHVTPSSERGDTYGPNGVTTGVARTVLEPSIDKEIPKVTIERPSRTKRSADKVYGQHDHDYDTVSGWCRICGGARAPKDDAA